MNDIALARSWVPAPARPAFIDALAHHAELLRRRARRDRYLALTCRSPSRYYWIEGMFQSMSGR